MEIVLETNSRDKYLGFRDVQRYSDNSGFCAQLVVSAHGFGAQLLFCVEPEPFAAFIDELDAMDRTLAGKARLKPVFEDPFVELEVDHTGKVRVSGELVAHGTATQRLRFAFSSRSNGSSPVRAQAALVYHNGSHLTSVEPDERSSVCSLRSLLLTRSQVSRALARH